MDPTPTTPRQRPTRAKSSAVKTTAAAGKPARRRKVSAEQLEAAAAEVSGAVSIDVDQRIATTAYFLAAARNFEPGHELEDWLEAERRVRAAD